VGDRVTQLRDIHVAVADQLKVRIARASELNIAAFPFSGMPEPRIEVWPDGGEAYIGYYEESDSDTGSARVQLRLMIDLAVADGETAFDIMTDLLAWEGPSSIRAAIMDDRTLGGVVDSATVSVATWGVTDDLVESAQVPIVIFVQKET
jgi:hypothetical protein